MTKNRLQCNIFLIGFMGAGKSTVSEQLARLAGMGKLEMDECIAQREQMSIPEIFDVHGEPYFREAETRLLTDLQAKKNLVVSCGGGVPMRDGNVAAMKKSGRVVLLTASPETILARVQDSHDRPLIEHNKTVPYIAALMEKRREKYEAAADLIIQTDGKTVPAICDEIITRLSELDET